MRLVFALLIATALVLAVETPHFYVVGNDTYSQKLAKYLEEAYGFYVGKGLSPAPPCSGGKYFVNITSVASGDTRVDLSGSTVCVQRLDFSQSLSDVELKHLAYHEVAHIFQVRYINPDMLYDQRWPVEALPEGMAAVGAQYFYFPYSYFSGKLYQVNPYSASHDDWYKYSAVFAWYLQSLGNWTPVVINATRGNTDPALVSMYVKFLLALAQGVSIGGVQLAPDFQKYQLAPGYNPQPLSLDGLTAAYYEISPPYPGYLTIEAPGVVSNVPLGQPIWVNSTLKVAFVNPTTSPVYTTVKMYFGGLYAKFTGGAYYDNGTLALDLYVAVDGSPANGVVYINGTGVTARGGFATYVTRGALRPYALVVSNGSYTTVVRVNLTGLQLAAAPGVLLVGPGAWGAVNVTIYNPNPLVVVGTLKAAGCPGFGGGAVLQIPPGDSALAKLPFNVSTPSDCLLSISYAGSTATLPVKAARPTYRIYYDLDRGAGAVYAALGGYAASANFTGLSTTLRVPGAGYTAATLSIRLAVPDFKIDIKPVGAGGGLLQYSITVVGSVSGTPNATYLATVAVDGRAAGVIRIDTDPAGVGQSALSVAYDAPIGKNAVNVRVGQAKYTLALPKPQVRLEVVKARVNGSVVELLLRPVINFSGLNITVRVNGGVDCASVCILKARYDEVINISYTAVERGSISVRLPRPSFRMDVSRVVVTPSSVDVSLSIEASICNPSVDADYFVYINGTALHIPVGAGLCATGRATAGALLPYGEDLKLTLSTNFGDVEKVIHIPRPSVAVRLLNWRVDRGGESALLNVTIYAPPNYTYVVGGDQVRGRLSKVVEVAASDGAAVFSYGFGEERILRPPLRLSAGADAAELGTPARVFVAVSTPPNLTLRVPLYVNGTQSVFVDMGPGAHAQYAVNVTSPGRPGRYLVVLKAGPYMVSVPVLWYRVYNLSISAPAALPLGAAARVVLGGFVEPRVAVSAVVEAWGCEQFKRTVPLNYTLDLVYNRTCALHLVFRTNSSLVSRRLYWGPLEVRPEALILGAVRGLPVFAAGSLSAALYLNGSRVNGSVVVVGRHDALGLVNFTIYGEYMGVRNKTTFVGFAVPPQSYIRASEAAGNMSQRAAEYFRFLLEKAVATGDWTLVDGISQLYAAPPTPMTLLARAIVEGDLSVGRTPNLAVVEALRRIEPVIYGLLGLSILVTRRFI